MDKNFARQIASNGRLVVLSTIATSFPIWNTALGQQAAKPAPAGVPVAAPAVAGAPPQAAPKFNSFPVAEAFKSEKVVREKKRIKDDMLRNGSAFNEKEIAEYYASYLVPRMTSIDSPELCNEARKEMIEDIERAEKSEGMLKPFNEWLVKVMYRVASGNYHPAAGINATLIIGRLNEVKATNSNAPKPMGSATGMLMRLIVESKNDGVRAAALEGLERHIKLSQAAWSENQRHAVADVLIKSLSEVKPPKRSARSHGWLLGRSLELLTAIKHKKVDEVYLYAIDRLADAKTEPMLLEKALLVIGSNKPVAVKPELVTSAAANSLRLLVTDAKAWQESVKAVDAGGGGGYPSGYQDPNAIMGADYGAAMNAAADPYGMSAPKKKEKPANPYDSQPKDVKVKRRQLHQLLETVRVGLDGVRYGAVPATPVQGIALLLPDGPNKQNFMELVKAIETLQKNLNDGEIKDKATLASKTNDAFDAMINAAELFPGVVNDPNATEEANEVEKTVDENGDAVAGAGDKAADAAVAPAMNQNLLGDGFGN